LHPSYFASHLRYKKAPPNLKRSVTVSGWEALPNAAHDDAPDASILMGDAAYPQIIVALESIVPERLMAQVRDQLPVCFATRLGWAVFGHTIWHVRAAQFVRSTLGPRPPAWSTSKPPSAGRTLNYLKPKLQIETGFQRQRPLDADHADQKRPYFLVKTPWSTLNAILKVHARE